MKTSRLVSLIAIVVVGALVLGGAVVYKRSKIEAAAVSARENVTARMRGTPTLYPRHAGAIDAAIAASHQAAWDATFTANGLTGGTVDTTEYNRVMVERVRAALGLDGASKGYDELRRAAEELGVALDDL